MVAADNLPACIRFLLDPAVYPHAVGKVELVQTHISYVLLAGDFVYKVKKPVDFGFLDFTTLAKRRHFCEQEVVLNRRLCPAIYLEVVAITRGREGYGLAGSGEPVEYAVKMARLPEERMMDLVIARDELDRSHLDRIIGVLVPFYQRARSGPEIERYGTAAEVGRNVLENLRQIGPFVGCSAISRGEFEALVTYARDFLAREEVFAGRIAAGRIRDGHGDLYSANICLADDVYIFDCIEFNDRFRFLDVASDVAFLAMDLDYYGLDELASYFIDRFAAETEDPALERVLRFYKCYRAAVRGKIGLLTGHEPEVDQATRQEALTRAVRYFALARRYAAEG